MDPLLRSFSCVLFIANSWNYVYNLDSAGVESHWIKVKLSWAGPSGSRRLRLAEFLDIRHMKVASAQYTGRLYALGVTPGTHSSYRLNQPQTHNPVGRIEPIKKIPFNTHLKTWPQITTLFSWQSVCKCYVSRLQCHCFFTLCIWCSLV